MKRPPKKRTTLAPCTVHCCESPTDTCICSCGGRNHGIWLVENRQRWFKEQGLRLVVISYPTSQDHREA